MGDSFIRNFWEIWDSFIESFCKVEFLCYAGEPNWLGWIFIAILGVAVFFIGMFLVAAITLTATGRR